MTSNEQKEIIRLKRQLGEALNQLREQNKQVQELLNENAKFRSDIKTIINKGLVIRDTDSDELISGTSDKGIYLRAKSTANPDQPYLDFTNTMKAFNLFETDMEAGVYSPAVTEVYKNFKTRAEKLSWYLHSRHFLGGSDAVYCSNMVRVIENNPDKFKEAIAECGGDPERWRGYIFTTSDPWTYGVEVEGHRIFISTPQSIYNDTYKDYNLSIKE